MLFLFCLNLHGVNIPKIDFLQASNFKLLLFLYLRGGYTVNGTFVCYSIFYKKTLQQFSKLFKRNMMLLFDNIDLRCWKVAMFLSVQLLMKNLSNSCVYITFHNQRMYNAIYVIMIIKTFLPECCYASGL